MRALVSRGKGRMMLEECPEPDLKNNNVIVEVTACGICGTDLHVYKGMPADWPIPGIRGHEFSGTILKIGDDVQGFNFGDRVVIQPLLSCGVCSLCRDGKTNLCTEMSLIGGELPGGYAEQVLVPVRSLFKLPDKLDSYNATLVETLATPVHAFSTIAPGSFDRVAVFGAGPQGLFAIQLARLYGASYVAAIDVVPHRIKTALHVGATHAINASDNDPVEVVFEGTKGAGVDLVFEAAGLDITRQQAIRILRPGGTVIFVALGATETPIDFMQVVPKGLNLYGTQCYTDSDFGRAIQLLETGEIQADPVITRMPLDEGTAAFEMLSTQPGEAIKVVLTM